MSTRVLSPPMRPPPLRLWLGLLVAVALIVAETLVVCPLAGDENRAARP